tara:strand:+ start:15737 stop:15958 length:222 start_codon:yes stop_codon:yes gene_type:complete
MLITKEQQEAWVNEFDSKGNSYSETYGYSLGINKALTEVSKGCIDKQIAIRFAQSLTNHEVTEGDLTEFLKNQ